MIRAALRARTKPDLVLHIGSGKTGTSSIQRLLGRNRDRLAELEWLYPESPSNNRDRHARFGTFAQPDDRILAQDALRREAHDTPARFRRALRRELLDEITRSGARQVLLSDEVLYGSSEEAIERVHRFARRASRRVRLVVYLRRQDDHLISRYQQVIKMGETRRLAERTRQVDFSAPYDYHARLSSWRRVLAPDDFVVRRFEGDRFVGGSLYQDFFDACGLPLAADDLRPVALQNESLDAEAVELLRLLNLYRVENEGANVGATTNRRFVVRLSRASSGPVLTLPESVLDPFMAGWQKSNSAVARDFLQEDGALFRSPRRTRDVTTHQVLDPARLDHYLTLLELPERLHEPLRRLAEREAAHPDEPDATGLARRR